MRDLDSLEKYDKLLEEIWVIKGERDNNDEESSRRRLATESD